MTPENEELKTEKLFHLGISPYSFRSGEAAEIIGVATVVIKNIYEPCFHIRFADGMTDWCPISDKDNYELLSEKDVVFKFAKR